MYTLFSFTDMLPMIKFLVGAIPVVTFAGMCVFALSCLLTEGKREKAMVQNNNQLASVIPLFNVGQCN